MIDGESHGDVILDAKVIAVRYLKGWFVVDFFSSLPIDYIFLTYEGSSYTAGRAIRILRLAKLLQLLRLLRISRLVRYVRIWQEVSLPMIYSSILSLATPTTYCRIAMFCFWKPKPMTISLWNSSLPFSHDAMCLLAVYHTCIKIYHMGITQSLVSASSFEQNYHNSANYTAFNIHPLRINTMF